MPRPPRSCHAIALMVLLTCPVALAQQLPPSNASPPHPGWLNPTTLSPQKQMTGIQYVAQAKTMAGMMADDMVLSDPLLPASESTLRRLHEALCGMQLWAYDAPNGDYNSEGEYGGGAMALDKRIWCDEMPGGWTTAEIIHEATHTMQTFEWASTPPPNDLSGSALEKFREDERLLCYAHTLVLEARAIERSKNVLTTAFLTGHITSQELCEGLDEALGGAGSHLNAAAELLGLDGRESSLAAVSPSLQSQVPAAMEAAQRGQRALDFVFDEIDMCIQSNNCE